MKISTKKALIASVLSLVLCVSMLVGSTFAWFTDTATTSVNKIVAGRLDVELWKADLDESLDVTPLKWVKAAGAEGEDVLWEPGCTYDLESFRIKNNGTLALKYKVVISGLVGSAKLLNAIEFTVTVDGTELEAKDGVSTVQTVADLNNFEGKLAAGAVTGKITITGKMRTDAGNEYQNEKIEGIAITVYATQDTVEKDSNGNTYDDGAAYTEVIDAGKTFTGKQTLDVGITATNADAIAVRAIGADADVTITGGTFDGGKGGNNICVAAANGAKVTIKDGTFTVGGDANGYGNSVVYSQGGNVVIEGGFFYTNYSYGGRYYVLNQYNSNPGTITVTGGTFVNYNPAGGDDNLGGDFVADGYMVVAKKQANGDVWYTVVEASAVKEPLKAGGEVTVDSDTYTNNSADTAEARLTITVPTTLNLNAKIVTPDGMGNNNTNFCALIVDADTTINATENGGIDTGTNGGYGITVRNGATLTINGGNYYGGGTAVQVQKGTLIINGGTFACEPYSNPVYGSKFLINCIDEAYKNGSAKIIIKGGTFINFDPSDSASENPHGNFVADGYKVVEETHGTDTWYIVVPK